jgi:hypothetical protein
VSASRGPSTSTRRRRWGAGPTPPSRRRNNLAGSKPAFNTKRSIVSTQNCHRFKPRLLRGSPYSSQYTVYPHLWCGRHHRLARALEPAGVTLKSSEYSWRKCATRAPHLAAPHLFVSLVALWGPCAARKTSSRGPYLSRRNLRAMITMDGGCMGSVIE